MSDFTITPAGSFSLRESALFGFGQRDAQQHDTTMRMAFCLDGYREQVAVALTQDAAGIVHGTLADGVQAGVDAVRNQVARVLSLDHDGTAYEAIGDRDPVIAALQAVAPGLRPPLFYSPYEAAAWAVLSARRPAAQMSALRARLSAAYGRTFEVAGQTLSALPTPEQLLTVDEFPGLPDLKRERLHAIARAAQDGHLDASRLLALGPEAAMSQVQQLQGIGPFYASLIVIRGTGFADVLPTAEPRLLGLVRDHYGLAALPGASEFERIAEPWRPMRTWASVLIRAASSRLLQAA
jgi:DNA-3-methyladenine glycosylase II